MQIPNIGAKCIGCVTETGLALNQDMQEPGCCRLKVRILQRLGRRRQRADSNAGLTGFWHLEGGPVSSAEQYGIGIAYKSDCAQAYFRKLCICLLQNIVYRSTLEYCAQVYFRILCIGLLQNTVYSPVLEYCVQPCFRILCIGLLKNNVHILLYTLASLHKSVSFKHVC